MEFKEFLKEVRVSRGLSQKDLGSLMHLEPQAISNYERGKNCYLKNIKYY